MTRGPHPLRVGVAELLARPGERRELRLAVAVDDLRLSSAWVAPDDDVEVDLVLESVLGGRITAGGTVSAPWNGECRRCLGPVQGELRAEVHEVYTEEGSEDAADPDLRTFRGAEINLEPVVREAVLLALPLAPLCREDCPGPAPERAPVALEDDTGPAADPSGEDGGEDAAPDPRWAALDDLRFDE